MSKSVTLMKMMLKKSMRSHGEEAEEGGGGPRLEDV